MKRLRILVLMHEDLVPPEPRTGQDVTRSARSGMPSRRWGSRAISG